MSYDGRLGFGLMGDFDALPDIDELGEDIERAVDALAVAAGVTGAKATRPRKARTTTPAAT
jgi:diacylglycerol O-acyltransferase